MLFLLLFLGIKKRRATIGLRKKDQNISMTRYFGDAVFEGAEVSDKDYDRLQEQRAEESGEIGITQAVEAHKIAGVEHWAEEEITRIREMAQAEIDAILGAKIVETVYELQGEKDACEICTAKIGEIGTMAMLEERDCVPPFHKQCRCNLEVAGYAVL